MIASVVFAIAFACLSILYDMRSVRANQDALDHDWHLYLGRK